MRLSADDELEAGPLFDLDDDDDDALDSVMLMLDMINN